MKNKTLVPRAMIKRVGLLLLLSNINLQLSTWAQGTAFTYQGRLTDNSSPANGAYDLRFAMYDALSGGALVGGPITNPPVAVSNGLFTVTLDFGSNTFTGAGRWLEIGVRANGGADSFQPLSPRQFLASAPYAVRAANFSGPISDSQLSSNIARLDGTNQTFTGTVNFSSQSNNYTGTFSGDGAGMTNIPGAIPSQTVVGASVQAQPNTAYLANDPGQVTVTLATTANVGDVVRVQGLGAGGWRVVAGPNQAIDGYQAGVYWIARGGGSRTWASVASSADGSELIAADYGGQIYISTDSGMNWTPRDNNRNWNTIASSADGTKLVAGAEYGQIYTSTDAGTNWTARESNRRWLSVASSADGAKLVAVANSGQIWISADSGVTWTARENNRSWNSVASSADGTKLVALAYGEPIYTSTDSGTTWTTRDTNRAWHCVASSADGTRLVAGVFPGQLYISLDSGITWTARASSDYWNSIASSADGTRLAAAIGAIYTSSDSATNWTLRQGAPYLDTVASSADGNKLVAVHGGGPIYTSTAIPLVGAQGSSLDLRYAGNGLWVPVGLPQSATNAPNSTVTRDGSGNFTAGTITARAFVGDGSGLTNLSFVGNGYSLTNLNAANITSGTLADARLSGNVPLLNGSPSFIGQITANSGVRLNNDGNLWLRGNGDLNHGLGWYGTGKLFNGVNVDGPMLFGASGGGLGTTVTGFSTNIALYWRSSGRVGIGTTSPAFLLEVNGTAGKPGGGSWSTSSDARLKKNIRPLTGALDKLLALRGVSFEFIDPEKIHELSGERMGLVAQEVEKVFPDWVQTGPDGYKRVTVRGLEALVVESLRQLKDEQASETAALKTENQSLARRLADQEKEIAAMKQWLMKQSSKE